MRFEKGYGFAGLDCGWGDEGVDFDEGFGSVGSLVGCYLHCAFFFLPPGSLGGAGRERVGRGCGAVVMISTRLTKTGIVLPYPINGTLVLRRRRGAKVPRLKVWPDSRSENRYSASGAERREGG